MTSAFPKFSGWVFFLGLFIGSIILATETRLPWTVVSGGAATIGLFFLFHAQPLFLLSGLIILRMSLDYSAQFVKFDLLGFTVTLSQAMGILIALLGLILLIKKRSAIRDFPLLLPYGLVALWGFGTLSYTLSPWSTMYELVRIFDLFVIGFFAYVSIHDIRDFRRLLFAIFIAGLLPILFGIFQFIFNIGLNDEHVSIPRIFGTFSHPNVFSLFLMTEIALASTYLLTLTEKKSERFLLLAFLGLFSLALLLTYARIAWIALFLFGILIALFRYRILLVPIIFMPLVLLAFSPTIQERIVESLHPTPDSSITWRQNLWHDLILKTNIEDRTGIGYGMDTFRLVSESLRGTRFGSNESHNDFVKFYVEGGMVGLLVYLAYLGSFFYILRRAYRESGRDRLLRTTVLFLSFLFIVLTVASYSDNVFKNTPVQWLLAAVLGGLFVLTQQKEHPGRMLKQ